MSSGAIDEYKDDFEDYEDDVDDAVEFQSGAPRLVSTLAKCMSGPVSESFTAISHSDVLCCLEDKLTVLQECRRVINADGRMCFTVIRLANGLKGTAMERAVQAGPEFIHSETHYPSMLHTAGWQIIQQDDITRAFCASIERMIAAEEKQSESLRALRGNEANEIAQANWRYKLQAVTDGLILREFFSVVPA